MSENSDLIDLDFTDAWPEKLSPIRLPGAQDLSKQGKFRGAGIVLPGPEMRDGLSFHAQPQKIARGLSGTQWRGCAMSVRSANAFGRPCPTTPHVAGRAAGTRRERSNRLHTLNTHGALRPDARKSSIEIHNLAIIYY
jgi:hypothetical protein